MNRIIVLVTCHNRRTKTLACFDALFSAYLPDSFTMDVILVDDGSSDGTGDAVLERFPGRVCVIHGSGNLFWAGGMRVAFDAAASEAFDSLLFLNDDTIVSPDALVRMIRCRRQVDPVGDRGVVVVGTTWNPETGLPTYGGLRVVSRWRPMRMALVQPADEPQRCDSMNTNCVLVPAVVARKVGNLDPAFKHRMADIDYGLRIRDAGFENWIMPGFVGVCENDHELAGSWLDPNTSFTDRIRQVRSPKGLPMGEWRTLTSRHAGPLWFVFWLWPYAKLISTSVWRSLSPRHG